MNILQNVLATYAYIGYPIALYYLLPTIFMLAALWNRNVAITRGNVIQSEKKEFSRLFRNTLIAHAILLALFFYFVMATDEMFSMLPAFLTFSVTLGGACGDLKSCITGMSFPFMLYLFVLLGWIPIYFSLWYASRPIERMVTRRPEQFRKFSETLNSSLWEVAKKYPAFTLLFLLAIASVIGVIKFGGFW